MATTVPGNWATTLQLAYFEAVKACAAATIGLIFLITIFQVFCRFFLNSPLVWAEESSRVLLIWMCFLFAGAAFQRGEMVAVDMFSRSLSARLRAAFLVPAYLATISFLIMLVCYGWIYARQNLIQTMPGVDALWESLTGIDSGVSIFWLYVSVPIGGSVLAIHMFLTALRVFIDALDGQSQTGDA